MFNNVATRRKTTTLFECCIDFIEYFLHSTDVQKTLTLDFFTIQNTAAIKKYINIIYAL